MRRQQGKSGGGFACLRERRDAVRREVDRTAGMVLAVAGRGARPGDRVPRKASGNFSANDRGLALDTSKGGNDHQADAVRGRGGVQRLPGACCRGRKAMFPAILIDRHDLELDGLDLQRETPLINEAGLDSDGAAGRALVDALADG